MISTTRSCYDQFRISRIGVLGPVVKDRMNEDIIRVGCLGSIWQWRGKNEDWKASLCGRYFVVVPAGQTLRSTASLLAPCE